MKKDNGRYGFIVLVLVLSLFPSLLYVHPVVAESSVPSGSWDNRYSYTIDYGNGTYKSTFSIGPQIFWDNETGSWGELKFVYDATKKYYLLQSSHMSLRVYEDKPSSYYDPDNQRLCLEKEVVEVEYEEKGKWKLVDLKNPVFTVVANSSSEVRLTKTLSGGNGVLNITYILRPASRLKHDFSFVSYMSGNHTFRVHFRLGGIPSLKVKYPGGDKIISGIESIGPQPFIVFGENNTNLLLSEYLWSLGVTHETTGEWVPTVLQDVILDVESGKGKADIIIGNYTLAENESLLIDPDSDTWQVVADSDDGAMTSEWDMYPKELPVGNQYGQTCSSFDRWTGIGIPQGATIQSAIVTVYGRIGGSNAEPETRIYGIDEDDTLTFTEDPSGRDLTAASVEYDPRYPDWGISHGWHDLPDITSIIQEIVDRGGWSTGNALAIKWANDGSPSGLHYVWCRSHNFKTSLAAKLEVTWEVAGGQEYSRDVSQGLTWGGVAYRAWDASRDTSQGLSLSSDSRRTWTLTRAFTQSLTFSSIALADFMQYILIQVSQSIAFIPDSLRTWSLSRTFTQAVSFTSASERLAQFVRNPVQSITASAEAFRSWCLTRTFIQRVGFTSDSIRLWGVSRSFTQGFTFASVTGRMAQFMRNPIQTFSASIETSRSWILTRSFNLPITFSSNMFADLFKYFKRTLTLGIQLGSDAFREWTLSRSFSQDISISSLTYRSWFLMRIATQSLTANIGLNRIFSAIRQASQTIALGSNIERLVSFTRGLSQSISLSLESFRTWDLSRSFTQGLSIISNIFIKFTEYFPPPDPEEFFRAVSIGMEIISDNIRQWSLTRTLSQGISFSSNIWTKLYTNVIRRLATLNIRVSQGISFYHRLLNEFEIPYPFILLTSLLFIGITYLREDHPNSRQFKVVSFMFSFLSICMIMLIDPNSWPVAMFFLGLCIVLAFGILKKTVEQPDFWDVK